MICDIHKLEFLPDPYHYTIVEHRGKKNKIGKTLCMECYDAAVESAEIVDIIDQVMTQKQD